MPDEEKKFDEVNEVEDWPEPINPEPSGEGATSSDDKTIVKEFEAEDRNVSGLATPNQLPYFVIVDGPRAGFRFPLEEGENLIGRATSGNITLDDKSVSRRHMTITHTDQGWVVRDEGSKNGTYVNGHKIAEPVNVGHKDTAQIGIYVLRLITKDISEEEEMAPPPKVEFEDVRDKSVSKRIVATEDDGEVTGSRKLVLDGAEAQDEGAEDLSLARLGSQGLAIAGAEPKKAKPRYSLLLWILFAVLIGVGLFFYWKYVLKPPEIVPPAAPVGEGMKEASPVPKETPKPEKLPVFLDFASSPLPAKVVFLNKEIGTTPVRVNVELEVGKTYTAEATFFMSELREQLTERVGFTITEDQSVVPILFKGSIGMIKINDLPRDAEFYLEGYFEYDKFRAKPAKLSEIVFYKPIYVPYGKYLVELRRAKELAESGEYVQDIVYRRELVIQEDNPSYVVDIAEEDLGFFPAEVHSKPNNAD
ncbi:FHA domain-containing protein, partial [bacterium]|nr:FHA domain-containing protein [bacterium]